MKRIIKKIKNKKPTFDQLMFGIIVSFLVILLLFSLAVFVFAGY